MSFPKTKTVRDAKYLAWTRRQPCVWCGSPPPSEVSHHGAHGTGIKPSDHDVLPLCRACHAHWHATSRIRFHDGLSREQTRDELAWQAARQRERYERAP